MKKLLFIKNIIFIISIINLFFSCKTTLQENIINTAKNYKNVPYIWGGTNNKGIDCSGLIWVVLKKNGYNWDRTTAFVQSNYGDTVLINKLQKGDIIFFKQGNKIDHVGLVIKNKNNGQDIKFIHAAKCNQKVKINWLSDFCKKGDFFWRDIYVFGKRLNFVKKIN